MTLSIWRYSHYILAIFSSIFIVIISISGFILSFEPISEQIQPFALSDKAKTISVSNTIDQLTRQYNQIISLSIEKHNYLKADVIDKKGISKSIYFNPITGKSTTIINSQSPLFNFFKTLHRSLFLKKTGRFIIGMVSILMTLICITGLMLFVKRQGGIKGLFT